MDDRDHAGPGAVQRTAARGYPFVDEQMPKKRQAAIINDLAERYPMIVVAQTVDKLKDVGFTGPPVRVSRCRWPTCWCRRRRRRSSNVTRAGRRSGAQVPAWCADTDERRDALVEIWKRPPKRSVRPWRSTTPRTTRSS